jgi:hypothetical protein
LLCAIAHSNNFTTVLINKHSAVPSWVIGLGFMAVRLTELLSNQGIFEAIALQKLSGGCVKLIHFFV